MGARPGSRVAAVVGTIVTIAYPALVYFGLLRHSARAVGLTVVAALSVMLLARAWAMGAAKTWAAARPLLPAAALGGIGAALDEPLLLLAMPVLISLTVLAAFANSLRAGNTPMIERFARAMEPELPPGGVAHCRAVTWAWVLFLGVNAAIAGGLAAFGPVSWWALYTGVIAYVLMGLMFTVEFVVRKLRFRQYGDSLADRVFAALFPPAR